MDSLELEDLDRSIRYWVVNVPYFMHLDKDGSLSRTYLFQNVKKNGKSLITIDCDKNVKNLFLTTRNFHKKKRYYVNGMDLYPDDISKGNKNQLKSWYNHVIYNNVILYQSDDIDDISTKCKNNLIEDDRYNSLTYITGSDHKSIYNCCDNCNLTLKTLNNRYITDNFFDLLGDEVFIRGKIDKKMIEMVKYNNKLYQYGLCPKIYMLIKVLDNPYSCYDIIVDIVHNPKLLEDYIVDNDITYDFLFNLKRFILLSVRFDLEFDESKVVVDIHGDIYYSSISSEYTYSEDSTGMGRGNTRSEYVNDIVDHLTMVDDIDEKHKVILFLKEAFFI